MEIWAIANQKGGVGKTTTTLALGARLAAESARVLLIDLDPHASLTRCFGLPVAPPPLGSVQLFDDQPAKLSDLVLIQDPVHLHLLAGQAALATIEKRSASRPGLGLAIKQALVPVKNQYEYVLIDCPPTLGVLMVNALAAAHRLIVPTQTDPLALHGLEGMIRTAAMIVRSRECEMPIAILPTLHDKRTRSGMDTVTHLRARYGSQAWEETIPLDTKLRDAKHILSQLPADRGGRGLAAYGRALDWLLGRQQELAA